MDMIGQPRPTCGIKVSHMSKLLKVGAQKLPTMLGAGIIGVSLAGLAAAAMGLSLPLAAELASAAVGIVVGSRYA